MGLMVMLRCKLLNILFVYFIFHGFSVIADDSLPEKLPKELYDAISVACKSKNQFVINSVQDTINAKYNDKNIQTNISEYLSNDCKYNVTKLADNSKNNINKEGIFANIKSIKANLDSSIEAGLSVSNGNTEEQDLNLTLR